MACVGVVVFTRLFCLRAIVSQSSLYKILVSCVVEQYTMLTKQLFLREYYLLGRKFVFANC